jgi:hypothetical protein
MRAALWPICSTPWLPNPLHRHGYLPLHDLLSKICDITHCQAFRQSFNVHYSKISGRRKSRRLPTILIRSDIVGSSLRYGNSIKVICSDGNRSACTYGGTATLEVKVPTRGIHKGGTD